MSIVQGFLMIFFLIMAVAVCMIPNEVLKPKEDAPTQEQQPEHAPEPTPTPGIKFRHDSIPSYATGTRTTTV
jgi:hypothetical protein